MNRIRIIRTANGVLVRRVIGNGSRRHLKKAPFRYTKRRFSQKVCRVKIRSAVVTKKGFVRKLEIRSAKVKKNQKAAAVRLCFEANVDVIMSGEAIDDYCLPLFEYKVKHGDYGFDRYTDDRLIEFRSRTGVEMQAEITAELNRRDAKRLEEKHIKETSTIPRRASL